MNIVFSFWFKHQKLLSNYVFFFFYTAQMLSSEILEPETLVDFLSHSSSRLLSDECLFSVQFRTLINVHV